MASPPLVASIPKSSLPGCARAPSSALDMLKRRAVTAFFWEMSILPRKAPSMRQKALRLPPASTTVMFMGTPCFFANSRAPSTTVRACSSVMSPGSWSLLVSTAAPAGRTNTAERRRDRKRLRICVLPVRVWPFGLFRPGVVLCFQRI